MRQRTDTHWDDAPASIDLTPEQLATCRTLARNGGGDDDADSYTLDAILPDGEVMIYTYTGHGTYIISRDGRADEVTTRRVRDVEGVPA